MAAGERGESDRAHTLYEESLVLARNVEDGWLLSAALNNLGGLYLSEGNYERAIELFEESLAIGEARGDLDRRAREFTHLGHATRALGELARSHDFFRSGLAAAAEIASSSSRSPRCGASPHVRPAMLSRRRASSAR
jgi:tetratricopeptide (TPR) repeat protein